MTAVIMVDGFLVGVGVSGLDGVWRFIKDDCKDGHSEKRQTRE